MRRKVALIIGGSSGIGLATAKKLSSEGFSLLIVHRDRRSVLESFEASIREMKETGGEILTQNIDGTNEEKILEAIGFFQTQVPDLKVDVVVHSLSRGNLKNLVSPDQPTLTEEDINLTLGAMSINAFTWVRVLLNQKLFAPNSRLITLTSAGSTKYWSGYAAVAMAKASLEILTKYLAIELAPFGVRANVIHAGVTDTPSLRMIPGSDQLVKLTEENHPLGRMTKAEDVANAIYLLTRPEADWINGSMIYVDGGESLIQ